MKYIYTILASLLILVAVLLPGSQVPNVGFAGIDKIAHISLFIIWSVAFRLDTGSSFKWMWCLIIGVVYSVASEFIQILAEGRTFEWLDIGCDCIGLGLGIIAGPYVVPLLQRFLPHRS